MACEATAVLGPAGREFYVSKDAVYVWTTPLHHRRSFWKETSLVESAVFRLPLDGKENSQNPTALKTRGSPIDQFSFLESDDGYLNVLLRAEGLLASMWASEAGSANLAFFRVPVSQLGDGTESASVDSYHPLPAFGEMSLQNRYIGDTLVYGAGNTWFRRKGRNRDSVEGNAYALNWKHPEISPVRLPVAHTVDRIEALGEHTLLVGTRGKDPYFSPVSISFSDGKIEAGIAKAFRMRDAAQGETRSHGFFYKPDGKDSGILGLPVVGGGAEGWHQLKNVSSGIVFLKNDQLRFNGLGVLAASPHSSRQDNCQASCVDWYGNSRPLFLRGRIFALMGYELVEAELNHH